MTMSYLRGGFALAVFVVCSGLASSQAQAPATGQPPAAPVAAGTGRGQAAPLPPESLNCIDLAAALRTVANNDARMRDWPQIGRYREDNRAVTRADAVFMGDSITDFWPQPRFGAFFPGRNYVGRGISAQTTPQMLIRMRPDVIALKPKVVVILAGTNDIAGNTGPMTDEQIEGNLASMAELASANGIKVVLSSITPVSSYHLANPNAAPQTTLRPLARVHAVNDWMLQYAAAHKHVYLDYFSAMIDDKGQLRAELSADDLHPNAAGYAIMAPLAEAAIQKALAMK
jgi:lysophospholipase L1-like esterase